jgi:LsmAD domain
LHTQNGKSFTGILTNFTFQAPSNDLALVLSHVLPHPLPDPLPTAQKNVVFQPKDILSISATNVTLGTTNTASTGFRTDAAISGTPQGGQQRPLERWQPDNSPSTGMAGALESNSGGQWDQFATNERMFGVKTSYNEEIYTTKIDRSHPEFAKRIRDAEAIARDIEGKVSSNPHLQEERGQKVDDSGLDEEDKYSGVIRPAPAPSAPTGYAAAAAGNKYVPPSKRETPPVRPPPIDPAIIASKLREPKDTKKPIDTTSVIEKPKPALPLTANGTTEIPIVKEPEDIAPPIQDVGQKFVKDEKVKLKRARNLIGTKEKQRQFAEFAEFSKTLKLKAPVPSDLLPILAGKDANKQKAILERNQELKRQSEEKKISSPGVESVVSVSPAPVVVVASSPPLASPVVSPAPTLAERLKAQQGKTVGVTPSRVASPTPLEPGVVKPLSTPKKLDPSAREFVFKVSAKEFRPSFVSPSSHSPSPSRSSVVVSPPVGPRVEPSEVPPPSGPPGFWEKKVRRESPQTSFEELNVFVAALEAWKPTFEGEKFHLPMAYATPPAAWGAPEEDGKSTGKGYLQLYTEGRTPPVAPSAPGQDDQQSGHNYSRSSSTHITPHPPPPTQLAPIVQGFPPNQPVYPNVPMNYPYMPPPGPPVFPQQGQPGAYPQQLMAGQFQPQTSQYQRYTGPGYPINPPMMMPPALPPQYQQQNQYGQFPQPQYMQPPFGYVNPQQSGSYQGSPGRGNPPMAYQNMPPMYFQGTSPGCHC